MIDLLSIYHRGGCVLWETRLHPAPRVDILVTRLFEPHTTVYKHDKWTYQWTFSNEYDLIFVAVYLTLSNMTGVEELLVKIKHEFIALIKSHSTLQKSFVTLDFPAVFPFDSKYRAVLQSHESRHLTTKHRHTISDASEMPIISTNPSENPSQNHHNPTNNNLSTNNTSISSNLNIDKLQQIQILSQHKRPMRTGPPKKKSNSKKEDTDEDISKKKRVKQATKWDNKISKEDAAILDRSSIDNDAEILTGTELAKRIGVIGENDTSVIPTYDDDDESDEDDQNQTTEEENSSSNRLFGYFSRLVGNAPLTRESLAPVLEDFQQSLMGKNVAHEIAARLCESVLKSLEGKKPGSFVSVKATVRGAIEEALTRILTPEKQVDILQAIHAAKAEKRPYSIVFLGVNGVGKSTSLAKTAAYLLSKGLSVGIAACDTFRSGAIEQLRTHCTCLGITLYAKGYDRDAAAVCADSIAQAKRDGKDVVLVDTAGRMQDNEPLMRALAKLINMNQPDLVLFVGEALVGNDAVDQAAKFNRCLSDLSGDSKPRLIDGIILTKFDTIDDKVGAAISMAYITGRPIMFVGTGQTYKDLKRMNVKTLVKALLG